MKTKIVEQFHDMNCTFIVVAVFAVIGILISFKINGKNKMKEDNDKDDLEGDYSMMFQMIFVLIVDI